MAGAAVAGCAALFMPAVLAGAGPNGPVTDLLPGAVLGGGLLLIGLLAALVLAQRSRSRVCLDPAAGTVAVRVARGLRLHATVLPVECLTACAILGGQERVVSSGGVGAIGIVNLGVALAVPRHRTEWSIFLRPGGRALPILVTPRRALEPYGLLPLARRLAAALGCALDTPFDPDMARQAVAPRPPPHP